MSDQKKKFSQEKSLVQRLQSIMMVVSFFFLIGLLGFYLSSYPFLKAVQAMHGTNDVLNLISQSIESLTVSKEKMNSVRIVDDLKNPKFVFEESLKLCKEKLQQAIKDTNNRPEIQGHLKTASSSLNEYGKSVLELFKKFNLSKKNMKKWDEINSDLLIAQQYESEVREELIKSQIALKIISDTYFESVYSTRFRPLIIVIIMSLLFFAFVITAGLSITRRFRISIKNLTLATDAVATGNLNYMAPILQNDEIGNLTFAFNEMVSSLKENRNELREALDRVSRLQNTTAAVSEALTSDQVFDIIIQQGMHVLGAKALSIYLLPENAQEIVIKRMVGFSESANELKSVPLGLKTPLTDVVKFRRPVFLETFEKFKDNHPQFYVENLVNPTVAVLPLYVASKSLGGILFIFSKRRSFTESDKDFLMAISRQCALALHRAQLFDDAKQAIRARDEFLSIASHELKTPLTPLKLQLQIFSHQIKQGNVATITPEKIARVIETSDKQINRLASLIEDLLDVSRITSGKLNLNKEYVNLSELIQDVTRQYGHELRRVGSELRIIADSSLSGMFDKVRIEQVLINLLMNAVKYAPGRPIEVILESHGEKWVRICVKDQGPGILPENRERIFDRFERVEGQDNIGGLGLGLFISRQIIEAHGGKIFVKGSGFDGTTFVIDLPLNHSNLS